MTPEQPTPVKQTAKNAQRIGAGKPGPGRPKGVPNKATAEIREAAQAFGEEALKTLAELMRDADNPSVRVAAAKELLDRGYGRSAQHLEVTGKDGADLFPANATDIARDTLFMLELAQREKQQKHSTTQH